jgi:N-methylhydantoinase A
LYDLAWEKPVPLAQRRHRYELHQRILANGELSPATDSAEVEALVDVLRAAGVESVAVCLLNSYLRPDEERRVADLLRKGFPSCYVTASVDISPEAREVERTSTAVVNSYVGPIVERYVTDLGNKLKSFGVTAPFLIMQSSGGLIDAGAVAAAPVQIIESGPAAGVIAAQKLAQAMGLPNVVAFDMGGTTAKASLIEDGAPFVAIDYEVGGGMSAFRGLSKGGGYIVRAASIDIAEVGAGGGSIISLDAAGSLHVGPGSAGARPGPACYALGGERPTLTDANVVLGYLNPAALAGGTVRVDASLAHKVIGGLADEYGSDPPTVARGAFEVAVSNMTKAVKAVTSERGRDPRQSTMIAFGGAGPLYGAYLARELGISTVIVPAYPGLFSSLGLLVADIERQRVTPYQSGLAETSTLAAAFAVMEAQLAADLAGQGDGTTDLQFQRLVDMRYRSQRFELRTPLPDGPIDDASLQEARRRFHEQHRRTYGRSGPDELVEFVNLRVRGRLPNPVSLERILASSAQDESPLQSRACYFDRDVVVPVLSRGAIGPEAAEGPLIVEDMDATALVPPGARCRRDRLNNLVINWGANPSGGPR